MRLKIFSTASLMLLSSGCSTVLKTPIPKWDGEIYTGSVAEAGIVRKQAANASDRLVKGTDPRLNDFMAMKWKGSRGFEGFYQTYILGCEKWKSDSEMSTLGNEFRKIYEAMEAK